MTDAHEAPSLHVWLLAAAGALLLAGHHAARVHQLYVAPGAGIGLGWVSLSGAAVGGTISWRLSPFAGRLVPFALLALGLAVVASGYGAFASFDLRSAARGVACAGIFTTVALAVATALLVARAVGRDAAALGLVAFVLHPLRLAGTLACLLAGAVLEARVGFLRSGALTLALTTALAASYPSIRRALHVPAPAGARTLWSLIALSAAALVVLLFVAERRVPLRDLQRFTDEIVYTRAAEDTEYAVVASPGGYELFHDGQLLLSSLDEPRRTRSLVAPVLAAAPRARRVLLLEGGLGAVEREVLKDPRVESLTVVAPDVARLALARNLAFLAARAETPSPRWHIDVAEPLHWLEQHPDQLFDVILADFPWPLGYREGKLYTHHAFAALAAHLAPEGVVVVPAASAFTAPEATSSVVATLASTGLHVAAYHVPVPTLGVASYVVAGAAPAFSTVSLLDLGTDLTPRAGRVATLHDQTVVTAFVEERERR